MDKKFGPLAGLKVLEFSGLGPGPFAGMLLADMGADVVRVDRPPMRGPNSADVTARGKRSIVLDLKREEDRLVGRRLAEQADVIIEGFRPGVMERLGFDPESLMLANPRLIFGRITGWGQTGPLSGAAGHDLNYIALTGVLAAIGERGSKPIPPLNLVGDFGGGAMFLLFGILCALYERQSSGRGQVVDAAMVDGAALLLTPILGLWADGQWAGGRGDNLLDGGAHFYNTYACSDGKYITVAPIEPQFYELFRKKLGLEDHACLDYQMDSSQWATKTDYLSRIFLTRTRSEWIDLLEGTDVCFAPVLTFEEAPNHPHNLERGAFLNIDGVQQAAPAPRYSRTDIAMPNAPSAIGADHESVLADWVVTK